MSATLDAFLNALRHGGTEAARSWLQQQTARPMREPDKALFSALEGFVAQTSGNAFENPQRVPANIYPFLVAASLTDDEIEDFYADHPMPSWRLRFPVVLPSQDRLTIDNVGGAVLDMAVSPDGARIAVTSKKGQTRVWQLTGGPSELPQPKGDLPHILTLVWLNNHRLVLGGSDGHVHVWDVDAQAITPLPHKHQLDVTMSATDGERFVTCGNDGVAAYWTSIDTPPLVLSGQSGRFTACAIADNRVATGTNNGEVGLWNMSEPDTSFTVAAHQGTVTGCAFVAETQMLLTAGDDGRLIAWDVETGQQVYVLDSDLGPIDSLAVDTGGLRALTGHSNNQIALYDLVHAERMGVFLGHKRPVTGVAFSPDAQQVWSGSRDRTIRRWCMSDLRTPGVALHHASSVRSVQLSADGQHIASGSRDGVVQLWSVQSGQSLRLFEGQKGAIYQVMFSPGGQRLAAVATSGRILVWDRHSGETVHAVEGDGEPVTCCAFLNEETLITGSRNRKVQCWDLSTGTETRSMTGHTEWVRSIVVHPDGQHIATGSYDNTIRIWDLTTGETQRILTHHTRPVIACGLTPSGDNLVSLGLDGQAVVWSWQTGEKVHIIEAHDDPGAGLAMYGEHHVITVGQDHWVRTFDVRSGHPVHQMPLTGSLDSVAAVPGMAIVGDRTGNIWLFSVVDPELLRP